MHPSHDHSNFLDTLPTQPAFPWDSLHTHIKMYANTVVPKTNLSLLRLQAKSQLAPSMKTVAAVIKMFELGEVDDTPTAVQGTKAASDTFGATSSSLSRSAGESARAVPLQPTAQSAVYVCCLYMLSMCAVCLCCLHLLCRSAYAVCMAGLFVA